MAQQSMDQQTSSPAPAFGSNNSRRAWVAALLIPVAFVLAMAVGEGMISLLGYESGAEQPVPFLVALLVGVPLTVGAMIPSALAILYGRRARHEGHGLALIPIAAGWATLAYWVFTLVASMAQRALG